MLGKILAIGVALLGIRAEPLNTPFRLLISSPLSPNSPQLLFRTWISPSSPSLTSYSLFIYPATPSHAPTPPAYPPIPPPHPPSPLLTAHRTTHGFQISTHIQTSTPNVPSSRLELWERLAIDIDLNLGIATLCVGLWLARLDCTTVRVALGEFTYSGLDIEVSASERTAFDPQWTLGPWTAEEIEKLLSEAGCAPQCNLGCIGPTAADCSRFPQAVASARPLLLSKAGLLPEITIEGWYSPGPPLPPSVDYFSIRIKHENDRKVYFVGDSSGDLHLCGDYNGQSHCVSTHRVAAGTYVRASVCESRGLELCESREDETHCDSVAIQPLLWSVFDPGVGLSQHFHSLAATPAYPPLRTPDIPAEANLDSSRKLAATHYARFSSRMTLNKASTLDFTFVNTHSTAASIVITILRTDGATSCRPGVYIFKPYTTGAADWSVTSGTRTYTLLPSNSKIVSKGGMGGSYTVHVTEDNGSTYSIDISVLITCSGTTCFCAAGFFPNPTTSACTACPAGNAQCANGSSLGCISMSPTNSAPTAFSCSPCLPSTSFLSQSTGTCGTCDVACATCAGTGATQCITCASTGAVLLSPPGPSGCGCSPGFYSSGSSCLACASTCATCSGAGASLCQSCKANASLLVSPTGACQCNSGYTGTADSCVACDLTCATCSGIGTTSCKTCNSNATLAAPAPNSCKCNSGYWGNPDARLCSLCSTQCVTCSGGLTTQCLTCTLTIARLSGASPNTCVCVDGYYGTPPGCSLCYATCGKCAGAGYQMCTGCKSNAHVKTGTVEECVCNNGFYPNLTSAACAPCHATCSTCLTGLSTQCTGCKASAALQPSPTGSCVCVDGYYPYTTAANCLVCDGSCMKCAGGGTSLCTACNANAGLLNSVSPGTCVCLAGYMPDPTPVLCTKCSVTCLSCSLLGTSGCTACYPHASLLSGNPSSCVCDAGFFGSAESCTACDMSCQTCSTGTAAGCLSCVGTAVLAPSPGPGACTCNSGPFSLICLVCDLTCKPDDPGPVHYCVGIGPKYCTQCRAGAKLATPVGAVSGESYCVCESQYYPSTTSQNCVKCDSSCKECVDAGSNKCTDCFPSASLQNGTTPGTCVCFTGYFWDGTNCSLCSPSCKSCGALGADKCSACYLNASLSVNPGYCVCDSGFYPNGNESDCQACYHTCVTCGAGSIGDCKSCFGNAALVSLSVDACECSPRFYPNPDAKVCAACDTSCKECSSSGPSACTLCYLNASLQYSQSPGTCVCSSHFFTLSTPDQCVACDLTCFECKTGSASACTDCYPNASLVSGTQNACQCNAQYIPSPTVANCVLCDSTCATCNGGSAGDCLTCLSYAVRANAGTTASSCVCAVAYFPSPNSDNCQPCHTSCKTCDASGAAECLTCYPYASLVGGSTPSSCLCVVSHFPDPSPQVCTACDPACKHCDSSLVDHCTECFANAVLENNLYPSKCVCVTAAFASPDASNCVVCDPGCNGCVASGVNQCSGCYPLAHKLASQPIDQCVCDAGYYPDADPSNCSPCDGTCKQCTLGTATSCTMCFPVAALSDPLNPSACVCPSSYYGSPDSSLCLPCDPTCLECVGGTATECSACKANASVANYLTVGGCVCNGGFFPSPDAASCLQCDLTCFECVGVTASDCTSCNSFAALSGSSPSKCVCDTNSYPDPDAASCKPCATTCGSCKASGSNQCVTCKPGAGLKETAPSECVCSQSFYPNPDSSDCQPCNPQCLTCLDFSVCLTCKPHGQLTPSSSCECQASFYGDPDASNCLPCAVGCVQCDYLKCVRCLNAYYLFEGGCVETCPVHYTPNVGSECVLGDMTPPVPEMTVTLDNTLVVTFDQKMAFPDLLAKDFSIEASTPDSTTIDVTWPAPAVNSTVSFSLALSFDVAYVPGKSPVALTFLNVSMFVNENQVPTETARLTGYLNTVGTAPVSNASQSVLNTAVAQQTTAAVQGAISAGGVMSVMSGDPGTLATFVGTLQLMSYIAMTKIEIEKDLASTLSALNMGSAFPMPYVDRLRISDPEQSTEGFVNKYGIDSTVFLVNTNTFLGTSLAILASYIPVYLLSKVSHKSISAYFAKLLPSLKWGVPIRLWLTAYLDIGVYSMLQILNSKESLFSSYMSLNLILAYLFAIGFFATPLTIVLFTSRNYRLMVSRSSESFNKKWGVLFLEFQKGNQVANVYYCVYVLRRFLFVLSLTLTKENPQFIAALNSAMALSTFSFVVVSRPFDSLVEHFNSILTEGGTFIVYVTVTSYLFNISPEVGVVISTIGVWTSRITVFGNLITSVYKSAETVVTVFRTYAKNTKALSARGANVTYPTFTQAQDFVARCKKQTGNIMI